MFKLGITNNKDTKLKEFLNEYLNKFMVARHILNPDKLSMRSWNNLDVNDQAILGITYYRLVLFNNSLNRYYDSLIDLLQLIDDYEVKYDFNYKSFAIDEKVNIIKEYEDYEDLMDDDRYNYEDEGLEYHTIVDKLHFQFLGDAISGENFYSSNSKDFNVIGEMLLNIGILSPFKFFEKELGKSIPVFSIVNGEMVELSKEEVQEKEIKEKEKNLLLNETLYSFIDKVKELGIYISKLKKFKNNEDEFIKLRELVLELLYMKFKEND